MSVYECTCQYFKTKFKPIAKDNILILTFIVDIHV